MGYQERNLKYYLKILPSITHIANQIKNGEGLPKDWVEGVIAHI